MEKKVGVLTLCIGADYRKAMAPGLESKKRYCERWGYEYLLGDEQFWDRSRPIPWSKIPFILHYLDQYDFFWLSDADSMVTNPDLDLSDLLKDFDSDPTLEMVWWKDGSYNINSGQVLFRGKSDFMRRFFTEVSKQEDLHYHIWWENAGMIRIAERPEFSQQIKLREDYWELNSYYLPFRAPRWWEPGDRVLHFAGFYDPWIIWLLMRYTENCLERGKSPNKETIRAVRNLTIAGKQEAEEQLVVLTSSIM